MSSSKQKKTSRKNPKPASSQNPQQANTPSPPPFFRPDQPIYSPAAYYYPSMVPNMYPFPQPNFQQNVQPLSQPNFQQNLQTQPTFQTQSQLDIDFNPFDNVPETQFPSQSQQPPDFATQPRHILHSSSESSDESPDVDPDLEVEPEPEQRARGKRPQRATRENWTQAEEAALADAWLDVSEDSIRGKSQSGHDFKKKVWKNFCGRMGKEYRTTSQIYSKWRNVNKLVMDWNAMVNNGKKNWPSGATETDIINSTQMIFSAKYKIAFKHFGFWNAVKDKRKWLELKSPDDFAGCAGTGSKRSKTSESTHSASSDAHNFGFDLNADEPLEVPPPPPRPLGRDAAKRQQRGVGGSSSGGGSRNDDLIERCENMNLKIDQILQANRDKERNREMKFFFKDISGLPEVDRRRAEKVKAEIAKKYNLDD